MPFKKSVEPYLRCRRAVALSVTPVLAIRRVRKKAHRGGRCPDPTIAAGRGSRGGARQAAHRAHVRVSTAAKDTLRAALVRDHRAPAGGPRRWSTPGCAFAAEMGQTAVSGVGGTRLCDWCQCSADRRPDATPHGIRRRGRQGRLGRLLTFADPCASPQRCNRRYCVTDIVGRGRAPAHARHPTTY